MQGFKLWLENHAAFNKIFHAAVAIRRFVMALPTTAAVESHDLQAIADAALEILNALSSPDLGGDETWIASRVSTALRDLGTIIADISKSPQRYSSMADRQVKQMSGGGYNAAATMKVQSGGKSHLTDLRDELVTSRQRIQRVYDEIES